MGGLGRCVAAADCRRRGQVSFSGDSSGVVRVVKWGQSEEWWGRWAQWGHRARHGKAFPDLIGH